MAQPSRDPDVEKVPPEVEKARAWAEYSEYGWIYEEKNIHRDPPITDEEFRNALFEMADCVHYYGPEGHFILEDGAWVPRP